MVKPSPILRRTLRLALCVLLGAALAWLSGWLCAAMRPTDGGPNIFGTGAAQWQTPRIMPTGRKRLENGDVMVSEVYATRFSTIVGINRQPSPNPGDGSLPEIESVVPPTSHAVPDWADTSFGDEPRVTTVTTTAWGWPARCVGITERQFRTPGRFPGVVTTRTQTTDIWTLPSPRSSWLLPNVRTLPLRPIWTGLLLNASFYSVSLFLAFSALAHARRSCRIRFGLCPTCAYDLRATPPTSPCPECGTPRLPASPSPLT